MTFVQGILSFPPGPLKGLRGIATAAGLPVSTVRFLEPERTDWTERDLFRLRLFRFSVAMGVEPSVAARSFRREWSDLDHDGYLVEVGAIARGSLPAVERAVTKAAALRTVASILGVDDAGDPARAA